MSDIVLVALIAGLFQFTTWSLQKLYDKKNQSALLKKTESETKKTDAETIELLSKNYNDLNEKYLENSQQQLGFALELENNKTELEIVKGQLKAILKENLELKYKNSIFETDIYELQKENLYLRQESIKLKQGIDKLINQLKELSLNPVWQPPEPKI